MAFLFTKKLFVPVKYMDFANIFSKKLPEILPERTNINEYAIKLIDHKESSYGPIYILEPVELKTLKTYIETNLANGFIWPFKSLAFTLIFFVCKANKGFSLYVDY